MTTEEKLQHFFETCMQDARTRSNKMLDEYKAALEQTFAEHQQDARRRAEMQLESEAEKIEREMNKELSLEQINLKRMLGQKVNELKDKLFNELNDRLAKFLETPEYVVLLKEQIQYAVDFAGEDEVIIWMDPVDERNMGKLAVQFSTAQFKLSDYSFHGGTRAVIPSRHILMDHSFQNKLAKARETFHFDIDLGGKIHG